MRLHEENFRNQNEGWYVALSGTFFKKMELVRERLVLFTNIILLITDDLLNNLRRRINHQNVHS